MSINVINSYKIDDMYELKELDINNEKILSIMSSNSYQSLSYMDEDRMFEIYDSYPKLFDCIANLGDVNSVLMLGGGGFTYPKYYISKYPNKTMDVIEINKKLIDISLRYLNLDKLYEKHDPLHKRLNIICHDAYDYIINTNNKYDGIFVDLYIDNNPLDMIYEEKFLFNINRILNKDKFLVFNYILHESDANKLNRLEYLLSKYYSHIVIITTNYNLNLKDKNILILCSNSSINIPGSFEYVVYKA